MSGCWGRWRQRLLHSLLGTAALPRLGESLVWAATFTGSPFTVVSPLTWVAVGLSAQIIHLVLLAAVMGRIIPVVCECYTLHFFLLLGSNLLSVLFGVIMKAASKLFDIAPPGVSSTWLTLVWLDSKWGRCTIVECWTVRRLIACASQLLNLLLQVCLVTRFRHVWAFSRLLLVVIAFLRTTLLDWGSWHLREEKLLIGFSHRVWCLCILLCVNIHRFFLLKS